MRVYCDLDGVLADFRGAVDSFLGPDTAAYREITYREWRKLQAEWPTFWADLEYERHAEDLWTVISRYKPSILTAVPESWPSASVGKHIWCKRMLPKFGYHPKQEFHAVKRAEKQKFAKNPDGTPNILIDDTDKNIEEWKRAGGIAIHYIPSKSNVNKVASTIAAHME